MKIKLTLLGFLAVSPALWAAEGMWTLDNLPKAHLKQTYGFEPSQAWIDSVRLSAVRLAGGCSGSLISPDGLVMTNHHCARGCIDELSSESMNYVEKGFLASQKTDEKKCPSMEVNRLEAIEDVTEKVLAATAGLSGEAYSKKQKAISTELEAACVGKQSETMRCDVVKLYQGGKFGLYRYKRFQDVRLVWAPEENIAFFGGDPDNFNFPRYNLDASFLRVYENGKPIKNKNWFPFSANGAAENELVMTLGHPGTTQRLLTMAQLMRQRDDMAQRLMVSSEYRGVLSEFSRRGDEQRRIARDDLFGIENSIKARKGMLQTLMDPSFMAMKQAAEDELRAWVKADSKREAKYGKAWDALAEAQSKYRSFSLAYGYLEGGRGFSDYFQIARTLVRAAAERQKPNTERLREYTESSLPFMRQQTLSEAPIYPAFEQTAETFGLEKMREWLGADHPQVKAILGRESPEQMAARMVKATQLGDVKVRKALWEGGQAAIDASTDPYIQLAKMLEPAARALRARYENEIESVEIHNAGLIAQARFEKLGTSVYPDATFSLRLSDGVVKGWSFEGNAVPAFTSMGDTFHRATGNFPFALPASWLDKQAKINGQQAFNFVSTNDIIGGNSGSPIINRKGEVVGLVFDGNIHSLGGAYWFDERVNRTVSVHSGAIIESLRSVYGANALVKEIENAKTRKNTWY